MSGEDFVYMGGGVIAGASVLSIGLFVFKLDLTTAFVLLVVADVFAMWGCMKVLP